jgi:alanine-alpha-ketoisovalerate/valine-pyruvate aminotransferase
MLSWGGNPRDSEMEAKFREHMRLLLEQGGFDDLVSSYDAPQGTGILSARRAFTVAGGR